MSRLLLVVALAAVALAAPAAPAPAFDWTEPVTLAPALTSPRANALAVNAAGDGVVAWQDLSCECVKASRRPGGGAWQPPIELGAYRDGSEVGSRLDAAINADGDVLVAWEATAGAPTYDLTIRAARLSADALTPVTRDLQSADQYLRNLGGVALDDAGNALVAWNRHSSSLTTTVWAAESAAGTTTWGTPEQVATGRLHNVRLHANAEGTALIVYQANAVDTTDRGGIEATIRVGHDDGWSTPERIVALADHSGSGGTTDALGLFNDGAPARPHVDDDGGAAVLYRFADGAVDTRPQSIGELRKPPGDGWGAPALLAAPRDEVIPIADAAFAGDGAAMLAWQDAGDGSERTIRTIERSASGTWSAAADAVVTTEWATVKQLDLVRDDAGQSHVLLGTSPPTAGPLEPALVAYTRPAGGAWSAGVRIPTPLDRNHSWVAGWGPRAAVDVAGRVLAVFNGREPGADDYRLLALTGDETAGGGVEPEPEPGPDPGPVPGPVPDVPGAGPAPVAPGAQAPTARTDLTVHSTETRRAMPAVLGRRIDRARDAVERAGIRADFAIVESHRKVKGAAIGDVIAQLPRAGARLLSSVAEQPRVKLTLYAGPKPQPAKRGRACPIGALDRDLKRMDLDVADEILGKQRVKTTYDITVSSSAKEPEVTKIRRDGRCGATVAVRVPKRPVHNDLYLVLREHPTGMSFGADDWALTAGERNAYTLQVVDAAGRLVRGAEVTVDNSATGAPVENQAKRTDGNGEASFTTMLPKKGTVSLLARAPGANDVELWGTAQLRVADRSREDCFETVTGRAYRRGRGGWSAEASSRPCDAGTPRARAASSGNLLTWVLEQLFGRSGPAEPPTQARRALRTIATEQRAFPAQIAFGQTIGTALCRADVVNGPVNVVSAGSGNVISAGSGNVISAGSGNAVVTAKAGVISAGGGNVISAGSGNVISAGSGNVISAGSGNVISAGGGNVISAGGGNAIAINNAGLLSDKGAGLIGGAGGNLAGGGLP